MSSTGGTPQWTRTGAGQFTLSGPVVLATVADLRDRGMREMRRELGELQVDLREAMPIDSAGLALLVDWLAWAQSCGRSLHYRQASDAMRALARISEVERLLLREPSQPGEAPPAAA